MKKHKYIEPFLWPVDPVALNIPDYPQIIKEPMDLATVEKKLKSHEYNTYAEFEEDMSKIWRNALTYNPSNSPIHRITMEIKSHFEKINTEDRENEKYNKMRDGILKIEKKFNGAQNKSAAMRNNKSFNFKNSGMEHPLTYQEKKNLSTMIRSLETEHLLGVWEIVSEGNDQIKDNEIEFDIETLPVRKARELEKYVQTKLELMRKNKKKKVKTEMEQTFAAPLVAPPVTNSVIPPVVPAENVPAKVQTPNGIFLQSINLIFYF